MSTADDLRTVGVLGGMSSESTVTDGIVREGSRERYLEVVDGLVAAGADGVVLGCTEIDLLIDQADRPDVPLFDTTALHVERVIEHSLGAAVESRDAE